MQRYDAQLLANVLNALTEVFERKPISPKALEVWFETLKEFPTDRVVGLLQNWAKGHGKMPVPAEVWKVINETAIDEREAKDKQERFAREREYQRMPATDAGRRTLGMIREMLSKPKRSPIQHWEAVLATKGLPDVSYEYANKALAKLRPRDRTPGEDDEEVELMGRDDG